MAGKTCLVWAVRILVLHLALSVLLDLFPDAASKQLGWAAADAALLRQTRERLGLAATWPERHVQRLAGLFHGDLGESLIGRYRITPLLMRRLLVSVPFWLLGCAAMLLAVHLAALVAIPERRLPIPAITRVGATVGLMPQLLIAIILYGLYDRMAVSPLLLNNPMVAHLLKFTLASLGVALFPACVVLLLAIASCSADRERLFTTAYEASGFTWAQIRRRLYRNTLHAVRPQVIRLVITTIVSTAFVEYIFNYPGFGKLLIDAFRQSDTHVLLACMLVIGMLTFILIDLERLE